MDDKGRLRWVVVLTAVGSFMAALDTLVVASALTTIKRDMGASLTDLEWTVNAYNLSFAVLLVPAAVLGDRLGRARTYAGGLVLFALASAGCALAGSVGALVAMRFLQGAGAAVLLTLGLALLTSAFPPERRGAAIGLFSAVTGIAVACGPLVGGAVVDGLAWQWIFWLNVPVGLVAAPLVLRLIPEMHVPESRSTCPVWRCSAQECSVSCGPWSAASPPAGPVPRCSVQQPQGLRSSAGSRPGSAGRRTRCCRHGCCAGRASPPATSSWCSRSLPSSRRSSSMGSCCRSSRVRARWGPAYDSWPGRAPSSSSHRLRVRWPTGSANGCWSPSA